MRIEIITQKKDKYLFLLISTVIVGIITHGFSLFNKISFFDDIENLHFSAFGVTITQGRWFWGVLSYINEMLFGEYSIPWLNGIISLVFIALSNILIVEILDIKKCLSLILVSSVITVSIGTLVLYAYMYCAVYYSLAIFLSILSTYLLLNLKLNIIIRYIVAACLLVLSASIAQNYFLFGVIIYFYYTLISIYNDKFSIKRFFGYIVVVIVSVVLYALCAKLIILLINVANTFLGLGLQELGITSYQGMDRIGTLSFIAIENVLNVLKHIYIADDILFGNNIYIYYIIVTLIIAFCIYTFLQSNKNIQKTLELFLAFASIIVLCNIIYILQPPTYVYSLTVHQKCLIFLIPILICELIDTKRIYIVGVYLVSIYYSLYGVAVSNRVNLWRYFRQQNEIRWVSTFATKLQSVSGYNDDYDVYIYGSGSDWSVKKSDSYYVSEPWPLKYNNIYPFGSDTIQYYTWATYLQKFAGVNINRFHLNNEVIDNIDYIKSMPCYPDDGSIEVIGERIVVKFSEFE